MKSAPSPENEQQRLTALRQTSILDTPPERAFDDLVRLAAHLFQSRFALLTFVDEHRVWFKSRFGTELQEIPRNEWFCAHAIQSPGESLVVEDASKDLRFEKAACREIFGGVKFYAGMPVLSPDGHALGTLCVMDPGPQRLPASRMEWLDILVRQVQSLLELRETRGQLTSILQSPRLDAKLPASGNEEISTPIQDILGMTGLLLETQLDPEQRDCTQTIQICANHLLGLLTKVPAPPEIEPPGSPAAGTGPCVLVAEDNPVNCKVVIQQLQKLGCQTHAVTTGQEALSCLGSAAFDVILMDCQMPEMDGYEATRRIREREHTRTPPDRVPIIAITANAMEGDREKCLAAGMDDYITKPIRPETLKSTLERWVPSYRPVQPADPDGQHPNSIPLTGAPADMDRLLEFSDHDEASLRELLTLYIKQTREQLDRMGAAIQGNAPRDVERLAHSCAGSSATCGMHPILAPLRALESLAGTGRLEGARPLHNGINREFQRIMDFLETELAARYPGSPPLPLE